MQNVVHSHVDTGNGGRIGGNVAEAEKQEDKVKASSCLADRPLIRHDRPCFFKVHLGADKEKAWLTIKGSHRRFQKSRIVLVIPVQMLAAQNGFISHLMNLIDLVN